jgi:hypothetical protein
MTLIFRGFALLVVLIDQRLGKIRSIFFVLLEAFFEYFSKLFFYVVSFPFEIFVGLNVFDFDFSVEWMEDFLSFNNVIGLILRSVRVVYFCIVHFIHHGNCFVFYTLGHLLNLGFGLNSKGLILLSNFFFFLGLSLCNVVDVEVILAKLEYFFYILSTIEKNVTYGLGIELS